MLDRTEDTGFMLLNQAEIVEIDIESLQDYITDTGELQLLRTSYEPFFCCCTYTFSQRMTPAS